MRLSSTLPSRGTAARHAGKAVNETVWCVRRTDGTTVAIHTRYDRADGAKAYSWSLPDGSSGLGGQRSGDLPLYGSELLRAAPVGSPVIVTEGERSADACRSVGLTAVGTVTGASGTPSDRVLCPLLGRSILLWPDNDAAGRTHMASVSDSVIRLGVIDARVVDWPDAPQKGDAADFVSQRRADGISSDDIRAAILALPRRQGASVHAVGVGTPTPSDPMALTDLTSAPRTEDREVRLTEWSGSDLLRMDLTATPESLPMLGREGIIIKGHAHVLSGFPKFGKTTLLVQAMTEWIGAGCRVLFLTEESKPVWGRRLKAVRADWSNLTVVPAMGVDGHALLSRAVGGSEDVVIIDTIRGVLMLRDENDNSEVIRGVTPWIASVCRSSERTLILVHHNRKGGGEHGEGIAGGHALVGIVDVAIEVTKDATENRRIVKTRSRVVEGVEFMYERDRTSGALIALGDPAHVRLEAVSERVVAALRDADDWVTTAAVRDLLDDPQPSTDTVQRSLASLAHKGAVHRSPPIAEGGVSGKRVTWSIASSDLTSDGPSPIGGGEVHTEVPRPAERVRVEV